ncbi:MAG: 6,7-dimethyl-8-ribityllumazine synthase [Bacteroidetes bacterium]|nr:6,7-dimethyl-8-ribityllumazine synthase [Bacteroidota bacterium]
MGEVGKSNLYDIDTGILPKSACVVIVRTEWNAAIVDKLEEGCIRVLNRYNIKYKVLVVPGAFEVPFGIKQYWDVVQQRTMIPDAFIAFACVIRGGTPHFDYVCQGITNGITQLNLNLPVPTIYGVLTVDNEQQALERIGGVHGHKGEEAAITALKMIAMKNG